MTSIRGSDVTLELPSGVVFGQLRVTVGTFVGIRTPGSTLVGTIKALEALGRPGPGDTGQGAKACIDLLGEIFTDETGEGSFRRGIHCYPAIGDSVEKIGRRELRLIYNRADKQTIRIGHLHQDPTVPAVLNVRDLLTKHFAVLGTTGVGKSSGVAVILQQLLDAQPDLRILLLDGHNEYGSCFGDRAHVTNPRHLKLPFWLFNLEEIVDVIYAGRPAVADEVDILVELIPIAKSTYGQYKTQSDRPQIRRDPKTTGYTVDTPVPYLLQDLVALIDERMGRLDNRSSRMVYHRLLSRIDTLRNDPRYTFMFHNANVGGDTMGELLTQLFRIEADGKPMSVIQLAGLPAEVIDPVVCVLCRLAFDFGLWSEGAIPLLFVCEEAHRFASNDPAVGFHPTRRALSRIAKEGRKHGVHLGLVTQRPAELDPTIISQCSTLLAMRMNNERDQALLRSAVADSSADLLSFVPSLATREVIGFGDGVPLSVRMTFDELRPELIPNSDAADTQARAAETGIDRDFIRAVVERWRGATMTGRPKIDPGEPEPGPAPAAAPGTRVQTALDQARHRLLKRALDTTPPSGLGTPGQLTG